jgi:arylsulfatase A-like enzyme
VPPLDFAAQLAIKIIGAVLECGDPRTNKGEKEMPAHLFVIRLIATLFVANATILLVPPTSAQAARPNIVLIYADDIGYGDLGCYGATAVKTPRLDQLARDGLRFTDAHCGSATCTPSRYSLLTGEYAWRKPGTGILPGNASLIIPPVTPTLASLLKAGGYRTGVVGKWHLGLGAGDLDWNREIKPGPLEVGFDYCFLIPATGDRVPCVYVEDHRVVGLDPADPLRVSYGSAIGSDPTGREHPELLKVKLSRGHDMTIVNGVSRIGYMSGGETARWVDEDMADTITSKAVKFIESNPREPFFLFFSTHDIHVPRVPHARFAGRTPLGPRGDAIEQLDWCVGEILDTLDRLKLAENTIVLFTSDNGPVLDDGYADDAVQKLGNHKPAGPLRGGKYSIYEGGTRVPFILRWPARVKPGVSDALVSQLDCFASFAALTEQKLSADAAPDSMDVLPALLGQSKQGRDTLVEHAAGLALRKGHWKYIAAPQAGKKGGKTDPSKSPGTAELYDLRTDVAESKNLIADQPQTAAELASVLQNVRAAGRSR